MICFPPAALNGGKLEHAPAKVGEWVWQPKVDDWRAVLHVPSRTLWNQNGQLSSIAHLFGPALRRLALAGHAVEWLDVGLMNNRNDLMRGCIIVFDLIEADRELRSRRARLMNCFPVLPMDMAELMGLTGGQVQNSVYLINQWDNVESTLNALARQHFLLSQNEAIGHKFYEGLVAKRVDSLYTFGRKPKQVTPDWIKHRFDQ